MLGNKKTRCAHTTCIFALVAGSAATAQTPLSDPNQQQLATLNASGATSAEAIAGASQVSTAAGIQDIVVTARRTEESIQRTPVAVTALSAVAIRTAQITDAPALQRIAPNLVVGTGGPGNANFTFVSIRGAGNLQAGVANDPAVGTYIDGVYIPRPSQGISDLIDLQRIEVLRGPQGTLFGRNTPGGALNIITAQPTGDLAVTVKGEYGNYDYKNAGVILNVPLADDELAARFVYNFAEHDGYGHDLVTGPASGATTRRDANDRKSHYASGKLRFAPHGSDWSVTLAGDYNHVSDHGQFVGLSTFDPALFPGVFPLDLTPYLHRKADWYTMYSNRFAPPQTDLPYDRVNAYGGSATVNGKIAGIDIKSITAYRYSFSVGANDLDATPIAILDSTSGYRSRQFSQELQALGTIGTRFNYITGVYYSRETGEEVSTSAAFGFLGAPALRNDGDVRNISTGVFGQGYYKLTDAIRLSGGLRWTWDKRQVVLHNLNIAGLPGDVDTNPLVPGVQPNCNVNAPDKGVLDPCNQTESTRFNYPAWTAGVDFQASRDLFLYFKTSGAAQSGGWNLRVGSVPAFKPTKTKDVEIGAKTTLLDNRLRFNTALFYDWQTNVQRNVSAPVGGSGGTASSVTEYVLNAGDARVYGAEFEAEAAPWSGMLVTANVGLLRGHYVKGTFAEQQSVPNTTPGVALSGCALGADPTKSICTVDRSGEQLPQLPRLQYSIGATQQVPLAFGNLLLHLDYAYIAKQSFGPVTADPRQPASVQAAYALNTAFNRIPGYGLLNGRAGLTFGDSKQYEIYVFGKNILDKKYLTHRFADLLALGLGVGIENIGNPATYGIGANVHFGPR